MKRLLPALLALLLAPVVAAAAPALAGSRPNIIFLLTDDQGYGDISAHGNPILQTPNLDRLHREGVRFTDFHVSPTCAPTRSALLTGRHEFKNGITHTIHERERLAPDAITLAAALKTAGYRSGLFGKWHLGDEPAYWPTQRGFDEMFIHGAGGIGQTYPGSCGDAPGNTYFNPAILHNGRFVRTQGYCTDVFFSQALQWIGAQPRGTPFLAWIATNVPHAPLQVRPEDEARYTGKVAEANTAKYFGMIANLDDNVGRLLARLKELGIENDTLVVFMNDNGGTGGVRVFNAGMRGQKGTPWLGGTRASSFWRWPGRIAPADVPALAGHIDFFPTLAELAGAKLSDQAKKQIDGRSLVPLLANPRAPWPDRTLVTHVGRWPVGTSPDDWKFKNGSIRNTRWQLVSIDGGREPNWQLFDLKTDYGETTDVAKAHPDVVATLARSYDQWWAEARPLMVNEGAKGPPINPFKELYWQQFGGGPSQEDLDKMNPAKFGAGPGSPKKNAKKKAQ
jgi:arylsulfatase A-like enzyme